MADAAKPSEPQETEWERFNRELLELLNELRVAMPGIQVLFAFLLAVPFQQRFTTTTSFQRSVYFVALLASGVASACLIAPSAYHRVMFRRGDKPALIRFGTRMLLLGLVALAVAMLAAVMLVTDVIFKAPTVIVTVALLGPLMLWLWFGVALSRRVRGKRSR